MYIYEKTGLCIDLGIMGLYCPGKFFSQNELLKIALLFQIRQAFDPLLTIRQGSVASNSACFMHHWFWDGV